MYMCSNALCDTVDQLDGQRLNFEADFNVSEESYIFIHVPIATSSNFNCIFKLVLINRGKSLSKGIGWVLKVVIRIPSRGKVVAVSL